MPRGIAESAKFGGGKHKKRLAKGGIAMLFLKIVLGAVSKSIGQIPFSGGLGMGGAEAGLFYFNKFRVRVWGGGGGRFDRNGKRDRGPK